MPRDGAFLHGRTAQSASKSDFLPRYLSSAHQACHFLLGVFTKCRLHAHPAYCPPFAQTEFGSPMMKLIYSLYTTCLNATHALE